MRHFGSFATIAVLNLGAAVSPGPAFAIVTRTADRRGEHVDGPFGRGLLLGLSNRCIRRRADMGLSSVGDVVGELTASMSDRFDGGAYRPQPANPGYLAAIEESFNRQGLNQLLLARLSLIAPGEVHIDMPFAPHLTQHNGLVHAGVIASIAGNACGYAPLSLAAPGREPA